MWQIGLDFCAASCVRHSIGKPWERHSGKERSVDDGMSALKSVGRRRFKMRRDYFNFSTYSGVAWPLIK